MINYYPSHKNVLNKYNSICGHQTGILDSIIIMQANSVISENINTCTAMLPNYHKILLQTIFIIKNSYFQIKNKSIDKLIDDDNRGITNEWKHIL